MGGLAFLKEDDYGKNNLFYTTRDEGSHSEV